jgi:hypothetical protein
VLPNSDKNVVGLQVKLQALWEWICAEERVPVLVSYEQRTDSFLTVANSTKYWGS